MDDPKPPPEAGSLPLQGPHWNAGAVAPAGFFPLRLILYPGGCAVDLTRPDMVVGRHSTADVRLHLPDVSRRHCRFVFLDGGWQVFDLHSMNGLFVNNLKVEQAEVRHQDLIRIGSYTFEANLPGALATEAIPPSGRRTLERIADALPEPHDSPRRQAS
jgi:pSer/pThr/pTyr-binding forkhead associated (FHA) protein